MIELRRLADDGTDVVVQTLTLAPGVTVIGRVDCDLVIAHRTLSRKHARIEVTDRGATILDLGSANGIGVNGREVRSQVLADGDRIRLGGVRFDVRIDLAPEPRRPTPIAAPLPQAVAAPRLRRGRDDDGSGT